MNTLPPDIQNLIDAGASPASESSWSMGSIFIGIMFSIIGIAAWRYGKQKASARHMLLGVGLMAYGYFVPNVWLSLLVGFILTAFLFWPPV